MGSFARLAGLVTATVAIAATVGGPASAAPAGGPATASAAGPVQAGLTLTPSVTTVGSTVVVVGSATNTTGSAVRASLGIDNLASLRLSGVSGTGGCSPRNLTHLVYCGIQNLAPGATATIRLTLVPPAAGGFDFRCYARVTYTTGDTFAYGTLVVS